jgi:hypothetical protein
LAVVRPAFTGAVRTTHFQLACQLLYRPSGFKSLNRADDLLPAWEKLSGCCEYMESADLRTVAIKGVALTLAETTSANIELTAIPSDQ